MKTMTSLRDFFEIIGLFCVSLVIFTWGVSAQEVVGFDSRFYLFALEMWRHGPTWFPTTYGQPYPDYPATSTFIIYLIAQFMGGLNKFAAVLPSAIASALTVVFTYVIGALHNKRWGFYAVLLLLLTVAYFKASRSISLDMYSTLITVWCFYLVYSADLKDQHGSEGFIYLLFFLGFAFRGPIGLIIPTAVVCTYYLLDFNIKRMLFTAMLSLLILVFCSFILLGLAHSIGDDAFVRKVLIMEAFGRLQQASHLPFYFYLTNALDDYAISLPLAALVGIGTLYYRFRLHAFAPDMRLLLKLLGWVAVILIGMSIPGDKKIRYILPIAPALALMAAYPFVSSSRDKYFAMLHQVFLYFFAFVPLFFIVALTVFSNYATKSALTSKLQYSWMSPLLTTVFSFNLMALFRLAKKPQWRDSIILSLSALCFVVVYLKVAEVVAYYIDRTREVVVEVETMRINAHADLVFYKLQPDGLPIKYLVNMWRDDKPLFIEEPTVLASIVKPTYIVTDLASYQALTPGVSSRFKTVVIDKFGHVPIVVLTNTGR